MIYFFIIHLPDQCGSTWLTEEISPDQTRKAVVFERDCGATTDFSTQAAILKRYDTIEKSAPGGGRSFFIADTDHGSAPAGPGGCPEVRLRWIDAHTLEVQYQMFAHVTRAEAQVGDVEIIYRTLE